MYGIDKKEQIMTNSPISLAEVSQEWLKVKDLPSLYKHYPTAAVYQRWRSRFLRLGYLKKTGRRYQKQKGAASSKSRREYCRDYARRWRKENPERSKEINYAYWRRRLKSDQETCLLPETGLFQNRAAEVV